MNFAEADYVMTNTPGMLRAMGGMMTELGVQVEIEAFDTGHLWFAQRLVAEGVLKAPVLTQTVHGRALGAPRTTLNTLMAMVNNVPDDWFWSAFSLGAHQMPYVAAAVLAGRQRARRPGGQSLPGQGQLGHQFRIGRARRQDRGEPGRPGNRAG